MPASPTSSPTARASCGSAPRAISWSATSAPRLLGMDISKLRVTASEIGGGFGGKTTVFIEPVALALSRKANRPVKVVMTPRRSVQGHRPDLLAPRSTSRSAPRRTARITAADGRPALPGRRLPGSPGRVRRHDGLCLLRSRERPDDRLSTSSSTGRRRPPIARPRRRWRPSRSRASSRSWPSKIGMEPIDFRIKNAAREGTQVLLRPDLWPDRHRRRRWRRPRTIRICQGAARQEPGTRHGLRLLVQFRRPDLRRRSTSIADGTVPLRSAPPTSAARAPPCA